MSQPEPLANGPWEVLFPRALYLVDEIAKHGGVKEPFFTFGGGTVLMLRYQHRLSKDIDIFVPDPQSLGFVTPRLSDVAETLCQGHYKETDGFVKLYMQEGEIDFVASPNLLPKAEAFELWTLCGREVRVETAAEIVAKKMFYRGDRGSARDLFDLAMVAEHEPEALLRAERFMYRHLDAFADNLAQPSKAYIAQFDAIDTVHYRPSFDMAKAIALDLVDTLRMKRAQSLAQAHAFATANGLGVEDADLDTGDYLGEFVFISSHHVAQQSATGLLVTHERARLLSDDVSTKMTGEPVRVRYRKGQAQLERHGRQQGEQGRIAPSSPEGFTAQSAGAHRVAQEAVALSTLPGATAQENDQRVASTGNSAIANAFRHKEAEQAVRDHPELVDAYALLRAAQLIAEQKFNGLEDRKRFVALAKESVALNIKQQGAVANVTIRATQQAEDLGQESSAERSPKR